MLQQLSLSLRYLVSLYTALWYRDSIVTLTIPATTQEAVTATRYQSLANFFTMHEFSPRIHDRDRGSSDQVLEKNSRRTLGSELVYNVIVSVIQDSYPLSVPLLRQPKTASVGSIKSI